MTDPVSSVGQTQASQQPTGTKMKAEEKVVIFEGMTVNDVEQNGSEAQKIVAKAFDNKTKEKDYKAGDGKYSEREADNFNDYTFALDKNSKELRAHNKKTGCTSVIKYNDLDELKENAALLKEAGHLEGGQITFDLRNKIATFDGVSGSYTHIGSRGKVDRVVIKNSDLDRIIGNFFKGTLVLDNVKNMGMMWDSPTTILLDSEATLKTDSQSKVEVRRFNHDK